MTKEGVAAAMAWLDQVIGRTITFTPDEQEYADTLLRLVMEMADLLVWWRDITQDQVDAWERKRDELLSLIPKEAKT